MLQDQLKNYNLILASGSPRRKQFLMDMELDFEIRVKSVEESYPEHLEGGDISDFLAKLKAEPLKESLSSKDILLTSDTVVWHNNKSLAKASNEIEAADMLETMSGDWHQVITSVCFTTTEVQKIVRQVTEVKFAKLSRKEIDHYISTFKPYDKAGAYGIQEWIGLVGIEEIRGSYTNVVGLPTQLVYTTLYEMTK
ncbi:MAG: septum formation protein Maf [Pseudozobellia sp.]|nr:septum formation protein Maf [Pseudozobellia sp.]MBG48532.1 septum formation protein Maf [Pseudozobellia sp.]MBG50585.1 septum formation protein Maf [Pseudozobellia sp.]|tara:strand:+ start:2375 stop:2962 length:588 start_codon:yes stop_codon:yes gene_type:complete